MPPSATPGRPAASHSSGRGARLAIGAGVAVVLLAVGSVVGGAAFAGSWLRGKLAAAGVDPGAIRTVYGLGYRFAVPGEEPDALEATSP